MSANVVRAEVDRSAVPLMGVPSRSSATARDVFAFGLAVVGVLFLTFFVHWYEVVIFQNGMPQLIINALAPLVMFLVLLVTAVLNPLLRRFAPGLALGGGELVFVASLWLFTGVICYTTLTTPALHHLGNAFNPALEQPMMKRVGFTSLLRPELFLSAEATKDYYYGKGDGAARIPWSAVPWHLWWRPLAFWLPLLIGIIALSAALVRMMHRQWSKHELLSYPIAEFAGSLLTPAAGRLWPAIFYNKLFWIGFGAIFGLYLINGSARWFPKMIEIPLAYSHLDLLKKFPFLSNYCGREAYSLFRGMVYPAIVAIAVLLPTEISLTCWLGWVLMILFTGFYFLGTGELIGPTETSQIQAGMFVAMGAVILFIGRREYGRILRHAFTAKRPEDPVMQRAVAACRVFVVAFIGLTFLLVHAGLEWFVALTLVAAFSLVVLLAARMTAEIGIPWLVNFSSVSHTLPLKVLGSAVLGPQGLVVVAVIGAVLGDDMSNSIAAQETTRGKLEEAGAAAGNRRNPWRWLFPVGVVIALGATIAFTVWDNYSFGARQERSLSDRLRRNMDTASAEINRLGIEGRADSGREGLARLTEAKSEPHFWRFFLYGVAAVAGCALLRLRFTWWPLHPLPLLLINTWCLSRLYVSFFLGWVIKIALVRIGGGKVFMNSKPFFLGVIAGQIVIAVLWVLVGVMYHLRTGTQPPPVNFFL